MAKIDSLVSKNDFPIFHDKVRGKDLVYLDSAATTQKPLRVIEAIADFYKHKNANVSRGLYYLAMLAEADYKSAREKTRHFINAKSTNEIVFVRGTTEAINLVAQSFGTKFLKAGDQILLTPLEHHSNIIPWQIIRDRLGLKISVVPLNGKGDIDLLELEKLLLKRPKLLAITHISNVLGAVVPVKKIIAMAHAAGTYVLVDGAQAIAHVKVDVRDMDCDFYAFSSHKMYGPNGIGVLYGKENLLEKMPPYQGGGGMIRKVTFAETTYSDLPEKFEAGTQDAAGASGFAAAIKYMEEIGWQNVMQKDEALLKHLLKSLQEIPNLTVIGRPEQRCSIVSFTITGIHPHDLATILDMDGIAVRAGHHCAMPLMDWYKIPATVRISLGVYNDYNDIDVLVKSLKKAIRFFNNG